MKTKYKKTIKLIIPKLAFDHLHYKIEVNSPAFKYDIDIFYSILNDLGNIKYYNDYTANNEMIPMASTFLHAKYGSSYNEYMRYLTVNSIIYSSLSYSEGNCFHYGIVVNDIIIELLQNVGYYTSSYCLQIYNSESIKIIDNQPIIGNSKMVKNIAVVTVDIPTTGKVGRYIIEQHNKEMDRAKHFKPHIRLMERHYKKSLSIRYGDALDFVGKQYREEMQKIGNDEKLKTMAYNRYTQRIRSVIEISEGKRYLRFSRNKTNGRVDTNLTNMASELRQFIVGYENMCYLDLCNSQPVLFNIMLNRCSIKGKPSLGAEIEQYRHSTLSGNWYELLMEIYKTDRDTAKKMWMVIAYSKNTTKKLFKRKFAKRFPEVMKVIEGKKKNNYKAFSIGLQKIESQIFIEEICKELVSIDIIPYTLHDGLLVTKDKKDIVYNVMATVLSKHLGAAPVISINQEKVFGKTG